MIKRECVDEAGWVSEETFKRTLAVYQMLPGPEAHELPIYLHRQLVALAENRRIRPLLLGVTAGVIGLIAAVAVEVIETGVVDVPTALLAAGAFLVLNRYHGKLTGLYVVLGCGAIGAALQATVV
jgi:chromate transport protein ChrA